MIPGGLDCLAKLGSHVKLTKLCESLGDWDTKESQILG